MRLKQATKEAIGAGFAGIWINSYEHEDAITAVALACKDQGWTVLTWDPERGVRSPENEGDEGDGNGNPMEAILRLRAVNTQNKTRAVMIMRQLTHNIWGPDMRVMAPQLLQTLMHTIEDGTESAHHIVILAHEGIKILPELEKMVRVLDHPLPDDAEIWAALTTVVEDELEELPKCTVDDNGNLTHVSPEAQKLIDASKGLTRAEIAGAASQSLTRYKKVIPEAMWELKAESLKKTGALELLSRKRTPDDTDPAGFSQMAGLSNAKKFCLDMFNSKTRSKSVQPKGVTMVGPPGTGKSLFAKLLGDEIGWPAARLDIGALMGGLVGETESNTRGALKAVDAMAPLVLVVDEVEKALPNGKDGDGGVGKRMMGAILSWLQDHTSEVFVVFTANDISTISYSFPELFRSERVDAVIALDLPGEDARNQAWATYAKLFKLTPEQAAEKPPAENWTPADVKACCRQARLRGITLKEAGLFVIPTYNLAKEKIEDFRTWADGRCLAGDYPGLYRKSGPPRAAGPVTAAGLVKRKVNVGIGQPKSDA